MRLFSFLSMAIGHFVLVHRTRTRHKLAFLDLFSFPDLVDLNSLSAFCPSEDSLYDSAQWHERTNKETQRTPRATQKHSHMSLHKLSFQENRSEYFPSVSRIYGVYIGFRLLFHLVP